ncbi:50S ribosomal protein L4 [Iris pallida]|uniref:Large ribosomal subunit protein uL4c n=1 Tax=Iris pallida TaxID=29817 RepID=A0AAX6ETI0_IRIPA|nr:50S ribosomal protein L4 [Iris pallida]
MSMLIFSTTAHLSLLLLLLPLPSPNSLSPHLKSPTPSHSPPPLQPQPQPQPKSTTESFWRRQRQRHSPRPVLHRREGRLRHPLPQVRPFLHRSSGGPQGDHRRPAEQPSGDRIHPHPSRGPGGGKKPYPQKKTGRARRGSQRTPLRPGGGVTFGPKPRDWSIKINRKEKRLAVSTAIASAKDERVRGGHEERRWGLDPKEKGHVPHDGSNRQRPPQLSEYRHAEATDAQDAQSL